MPNEVVIICQRYEIENGGVIYPYFLGALDAKELKKISDAPSFNYDTPNNQIASEVLVPPTKHWQRPLRRDPGGRSKGQATVVLGKPRPAV